MSSVTQTYTSFRAKSLRCYKDAGLSHWQHLYGVWRTGYFSKQPAFPWVLIVVHYLSACFIWGGFVQSRLIKAGNKRIAQQFIFTYRVIDDTCTSSVLNSNFKIIWHSSFLKDTTEITIFASYLDLYLCIDNGKLPSRFYDKLDFKSLIMACHWQKQQI